MLDFAVTAISVIGLSEYEAKNAIAMERLRGEFKDRIQVRPLPAAVLRDLKKLAVDVVREEGEKSPMARKVYASFTSFQRRLGGWREVSEGAFHQFVAV